MLISTENLSYFYPGCESPALDGISLNIGEGEFVAVCGNSGSGKSTLLSLMKAPAEAGKTVGTLRFDGSFAGFVSQFPDEQIVCDKVWHELAFGAESIGLSQSEMRSRIAQTALFFGIEDILYEDCDKLSGGQKQMINLASVMVMHPDVLLLDEPLSQLDPIASAQFIMLLSRINRELGTAIVIAEHQLGGLLSVCGRIIMLDKGRTVCDGSAEKLVGYLANSEHSMLAEMPVGVRASVAANDAKALLDVPSAKAWYSVRKKTHGLISPKQSERKSGGEVCISIKNLSFGYRKGGRDVIRNLSLDIKSGTVTAVIGGNAAGKSTLLGLICNTLGAYRGKIDINGGILGYLPQDPTLLFNCESVREELLENADTVAKAFGLTHLLSRNPLDLSGGERQRAAIAKLISHGADILLLDEPTKGADAAYKQAFSALLKSLASQGKTIVLVSHDMDFCAETADSCALLFDGSVTACLPPDKFFTEGTFFTTDSAKIASGVCEGVYSQSGLIASVGGEISQSGYDFGNIGGTGGENKPKEESKGDNKRHKMKPYRKLSLISGGIMLFLLLISDTGILPFSIPSEPFWIRYVLLIAPMILLILGASPKNSMASPPFVKKRITGSDIAAGITTLVIIPLTVIAGSAFIPDSARKYLIISLAVLVECLAAFFISFEKKKPSAKDIAVLAVLCAAAVAGRELFFMFPQFKPVAAVVIISGTALGAQAGFLTGAMSMLVSNMLFGQGTWTPWQMVAMGLLGFFAGILFSKKRSTLALCVYSFFAVIIVYGGLMNLSSALTYTALDNLPQIATFMLSGLPFDLIHAVSTVVFVLITGEALLKKCCRIRLKFGLFQ